MDDEFSLVEQVDRDRSRQWSFTEILAERQSSRLRASGSIGRGRSLEDRVEALVAALGLPFKMRTSFVGIGGATVPSDLAIPSGGPEAMIVCAIKGFDSTDMPLAITAVRGPFRFFTHGDRVPLPRLKAGARARC